MGYDPDDCASIRDFSLIGSLRGRVEGLRIGLITNWYREDMEAPAPVLEALAEFCAVLENLGASISEIRGAPLQDYAATKAVVQMPEIHTEYAGALVKQLPFGGKLLARLKLAESVSVADYIHALADRRRLIRQYEQLTEPFDAVITAGPFGPAPFIADLDADWIFNKPEITVPFSLIGVPCMSLCIGFGPEGMPISAQIAAPHMRDALVLDIGHAYQAQTDWHKIYPSL